MGKTRSFNQFETQESRHRKRLHKNITPKIHGISSSLPIFVWQLTIALFVTLRKETSLFADIFVMTILNIKCGGGPRYGARALLDITMDASV